MGSVGAWQGMLPLSERRGVELSFFHCTGECRNNINWIFPKGCLNNRFLLFDRNSFKFFEALLYHISPFFSILVIESQFFAI